MADKNERLMVNICAELLRDFFIKLARNDAGVSYTTMSAYLTYRKPDLDKLLKMRKIRNDQYILLYPGHGTADENQWDVTLLVTLITELFSGSLQQQEISLLKKEIRGIRNELQHLPNTNISDNDFDNYWGRLETAVMTIAKQIYSGADVSSFQKKIDDAKCNNLPTLEKSLHMWYGEKFKEIDDKVSEMDNKLSEVQSNTRETKSMIQQMTVQKPGTCEDLRGQLSSTYENQGIQRTIYTRTTDSNPQLFGMHVCSMEDGLRFNIRVQSDRTESFISRCCLLPSGSILLADHANRRIKYLDHSYKVVSVLDLPDHPYDVCYIGNNVAVAAIGHVKLQYIDITCDMTLTKLVIIDHSCERVICHGDKLYITNTKSIYVYSTSGTKQRVFYTQPSYNSLYSNNIAINDAGDMIYLGCEHKGLKIIDHFGKHQHTFMDSELKEVGGICLDDAGNVFVCDRLSGNILQISPDGKQKLGVIENRFRDIPYHQTMFFDKEKKALVYAGNSDYIDVLRLK